MHLAARLAYQGQARQCLQSIGPMGPLCRSLELVEHVTRVFVPMPLMLDLPWLLPEDCSQSAPEDCLSAQLQASSAACLSTLALSTIFCIQPCGTWRGNVQHAGS